jgi:hypothetical protein
MLNQNLITTDNLNSYNISNGIILYEKINTNLLLLDKV